MNNNRNVLLVIPPTRRIIGSVPVEVSDYREIPYGVLSLASYIIEYTGVNVDVVDLNANSLGGLGDVMAVLECQFKSNTYDVVGVSVNFTSMFQSAREIVRIIRSFNWKGLVVAGGGAATISYKWLLEYVEGLDAVCCGEGEIPMSKLLLSEDMLSFIAKSEAWVDKSGVARGFQPKSFYVSNLDEIPPLKYDLLNLSDYNNSPRNNNPYEHDLSIGRRLPFLTSRGCPYDCSFCAAGSISGRKVRFYSVQRILSDIQSAIDEYGVSSIVINDDQFLINKKRAARILEGIASFNKHLELPNGINVRFIDEEISLLLKHAGLEVVNLAVESGSEYVLKNLMNKPLSVSDVIPAVKRLHDAGLLVHGFFIFGMPGESSEDRKKTYELIRAAGIDWSSIVAAQPLPGSRLYDQCLNEGFISRFDPEDYHSYTFTLDLPGVSPEMLSEEIYRINLDVNFVNNNQFRVGNYDVAFGYFRNVVNNYPNHAIAHYMLAQISRIKGDLCSAEYHELKFRSYISLPFWERYADVLS